MRRPRAVRSRRVSKGGRVVRREEGRVRVRRRRGLHRDRTFIPYDRGKCEDASGRRGNGRVVLEGPADHGRQRKKLTYSPSQVVTTITVSNQSQAPSSAAPPASGASVAPTTTVVVTASSSTSASESTLTSRQFITTTDARGSTVSTAPDLITTESVSTSDGQSPSPSPFAMQAGT